MFSSKKKKNVNPPLSFLISALVCKGLECFQQEVVKIWLQKTGFFFFRTWNSKACK